jgi:hypothetical protein
MSRLQERTAITRSIRITRALARTSVAWTAAAVLATIAAPGPARATPVVSRPTVSGGAPAGAAGTMTLRGSTVGEAGVVGAVAGPVYELGLGFWAGFAHSPGTDVAAAPGNTTAGVPTVNALRPNNPNPFGAATAISYAVATPARVRLAVYDVRGRRVRALVDAAASPGLYTAAWSGLDDAGRPVASGVYFCRLDIGSWSATRRMLKLR